MKAAIVYPSRLKEINRYLPEVYVLDTEHMGFFTLRDARDGEWIADFPSIAVEGYPEDIVRYGWLHYFDNKE